MIKRGFGTLEHSILSVLDSGKKMTVKQVQDALGGQDKYTTIMTVMGRLADKGLLKRERQGLRYEYWLAEKKESKRSLFESLRTRLFGMNAVDLVSYLINETEDFTEEDLKEVEKMIQLSREKRQQ